MKNIILITMFFFALLSCKAQQPIIPIYNGSDYLDTQNAYYKDIDGDFSKLVGTWKYTNGNEVLKITLKKKEQELHNETGEISYYEDLIYGEYQYINSQGTEVINTLNNIDSNADISEHLIFGGYIKGKNDFPVCNECSEDERRVYVMIEDPLRSYFYYEMIIRHIPREDWTGMQEKIKVTIKRTDMAIVPQGQPPNDRILFDEIILEKQ